MGKLLSLLSVRRSLRIDLLSAFGGVLLTTVLVVIFYFYSNTSRIVWMLCDDIMEQTSQTVIDRTISFFRPVGALTELSARIAVAGVLPLHDSRAMERYALETLSSYPAMARFIHGDREGNFLLSRRLSDGFTSTKVMDRVSDPPHTHTAWRTWDRAFNVVKTEKTVVDDFDPRVRPWYKEALQHEGLHFTDLYIFYTDRVPGITVSCPLRDPQGGVLGVVGCDIELSGLSAFLKSLKIGKHGLALIIDEKGGLVAFPDSSRMIDNHAKDGTLQTISVEDLGIPGITAVFRKHRATGAVKLSAEAEGGTYLAAIRDFSPSSGKPWKVVVIAPEDDFIGEVKELNRNVFLICMGILGFAALLVFVLSRSISRPILMLAAETDRIRNFELGGELNLRTHISEIEQLRGAVERMKVSLLTFTCFAPEQIVRKVVVEGQEAMLGGERRNVTLLFADLRNFTRLSEQTRPEHLVQILNNHFDAMVRIIAQHGGFVVDFLGDSLFAVFGAPGKDPDHAKNAVSCAVEMQLAHRQMDGTRERAHIPRLEMGIGINTGNCVVGNMGSHMRIKYGVVGHAVNLASRLESFTAGGQVLISESTHEAVQDRFEVSGPLEARGKGVESVIRFWEVLGVQNDVNRNLAPPISESGRLARPIPVHIRLIVNKQIDPSCHEGKLMRLSSRTADLETTLSLEPFSSLQVSISGPEGKEILMDGKVVGPGDSENVYKLRFPELDETTAIALNLMRKSN